MKTTSEERLAVAKTIDGQIKAGIANAWVYFSWGVSKKVATEYDGMPALALRVSGVYHKGWVYVALDYTTDTYKVYLVSTRGTVKKTYDEVYCDNLGDLIDRAIERGETSESVYMKRAAADTNRKMARG